MKNNINEMSVGMKALSIVMYILMIVAGIYLIFDLKSIVWLFFAAVTANGIVMIIRYIGSRGTRNGGDLIFGVINILFGSLMFFGSAESRVIGVLTIEAFIAIWTLFAGFTHIISSFGLKKLGNKGWVWMLVGGILMVICGIAYLIWPVMGVIVIAGIAGIYASISLVIIGFTGLAGVLSSGKKG